MGIDSKCLELISLVTEFISFLFFSCDISCLFFGRFASKEDDKWIRCVVKDLTVEAGSGLVVHDPVDVSAGYTSVKDKINTSIACTDIYVHLSLGVISLLLNLQNQASAALQFGNTDPLAPCTNFDRIWSSPTGCLLCSHIFRRIVLLLFLLLVCYYVFIWVFSLCTFSLHCHGRRSM